MACQNAACNQHWGGGKAGEMREHSPHSPARTRKISMAPSPAWVDSLSSIGCPADSTGLLGKLLLAWQGCRKR